MRNLSMSQFRAVPLAVALWIVVLIAPAFAGTETITGKLIDMSCYILDKGNTGIAHKGMGYDCAQACAREGFEVGLLTAEGKVYGITGGLAANSNAALVPHMSQTVTIMGEVREKDGQLSIQANQLYTTTK